MNLVDDLPSETGDAPNGWVGELVEGVGRKVEVTEGAPLAAVCQHNFDRLALVYGRRQDQKDSCENAELYAQVTLAVLPHRGLLLGLPPA